MEAVASGGRGLEAGEDPSSVPEPFPKVPFDEKQVGKAIAAIRYAMNSSQGVFRFKFVSRSGKNVSVWAMLNEDLSGELNNATLTGQTDDNYLTIDLSFGGQFASLTLGTDVFRNLLKAVYEDDRGIFEENDKVSAGEKLINFVNRENSRVV